jgi:hypothetical protein
MSLRREIHNEGDIFDFSYNQHDSVETLHHKREVRKALDVIFERRRLQHEIDELDGEFDWSDFDADK